MIMPTTLPMSARRRTPMVSTDSASMPNVPRYGTRRASSIWSPSSSLRAAPSSVMSSISYSRTLRNLRWASTSASAASSCCPSSCVTFSTSALCFYCCCCFCLSASSTWRSLRIESLSAACSSVLCCSMAAFSFATSPQVFCTCASCNFISACFCCCSAARLVAARSFSFTRVCCSMVTWFSSLAVFFLSTFKSVCELDSRFSMWFKS
mmetsp:Transcript_68860/g.135310  ORF Transcript_68860/g.135310 Transcript_68860/m.135310 type:complete len:208 (-) Transcript_68860:134-757(-)